MTPEQYIAVILALWGITSGSVLYIRTMYNSRLDDKDKVIADRDRIIEKLEARIAKLEVDKEDMLKTRERQMILMEESVNVQKKQAELFEAMYDEVKPSTRRSRTSGD